MYNITNNSNEDVAVTLPDYDPVTGELTLMTNDSLIFVEYQIPFCPPFTNNDSRLSNASLWSTMPDSCRRSLEVLTAVMALCSVLTTVFNIAVLISSLSQSTRRMRRRNPTMLNYSNYVISMAVADLLMGLVILPMTVAFMSVELIAEKKWMVALDNIERHIASSTGLRNTIGVLTHIALFASLYTIAAASIDRFYTSTQPFTNGSLRISRSSIRRSVLRIPAANRAAAAQEENGFNVTRSVVVLVAIWSLSALLSLTPLIMTNLARYRHVGHIFVVIVSPMRFNIGLICYTIFLALPVIITWIFSVLVCLSLWRRRIRLNSSSSSVHNTPSNKSSFNEKHQHMMSAAQRRFERTAECSTTEERQRDTAEGATCLRHPSDSEALSDESCTDMDIGAEMLQPAVNGGSKRCTFVTVDPTALKRLYMTEKRYLSPHHANAFDDSNVAKHMLYRRSWSGYPFDTSDASQSSGDSDVTSHAPLRAHPRLQASLSSPVRVTPRVSSISKTNRNFSTSSLTKGTAPNPVGSPRPDSTPHPGFQRQQPLRSSRRRGGGGNQRQSSVRIARNMLRSRSMELGIAKTLLTVVLTFTVITAPIIIVMSLKLTRGGQPVTQSALNAETSALVVSIMLLFSNSLWNSMIYGARMPYFRHTVKRVCRYFAENPALAGCCGKANRLSVNVCRKIDCVKIPPS